MVATARKITVEIPDTLLQKAQQASGTGITQNRSRRTGTAGGVAGLQAAAAVARQSPIQSHSAELKADR